jgi:nicotinate-nucleotide--dimethylbenzimidazole phosphoribosyltransferase
MTLRDELRQALDGKAKPLGSLGQIEELAVQLGMIQATLKPRVVEPTVLVFAGDHGAVASGVSAFPSAVTAAMVRTYLAGRAAVNLLARQAGARVLVVDAGVAAELPVHVDLIAAKVGWGTQDWVHGPAMTMTDVESCLQRGAAVVDRLADQGCTVLALGEMGIGNTASAALLAHKAAGLALEPMVGRGAGLDDAGLRRKRAAVAQGAARTAGTLAPLVAFAEYGGFEIAMLTGAILRASERRVCVVLAGVIVTAAAVVAHTMQADCLAVCVFAHRSAEPGHDAMLAHLGAVPLLDLGMRLGEGSGAALALPLLRAAAAVLSDMADLRDVT